MLSSCHIIFCFVHTTSSAPLVPVVMNADYTIPYYLFAFALATDSTSALYAVPRENLEDDIRGKKRICSLLLHTIFLYVLPFYMLFAEFFASASLALLYLQPAYCSFFQLPGW